MNSIKPGRTNVSGSLQNVQEHRLKRVNTVTPDHARTLILTLNLIITLSLSINPKALTYPYP